MTTNEPNQTVLLAFCGEQFRLVPVEYTDEILRGHFSEQDAGKRLCQLEADLDESWYLDDDGYRLDDEQLFNRSPWSVVNGEDERPIIQRFMDKATGEAWFALQPWVRIGDELNQKPE